MLQRVVSAMRAQLFGISGDQALFRRRGFKSARAKSQHVLEDIGKTFIDGYNFAVRSADPTLQSARLDSIPVDMHGFFVEGASMGFALFDIVSPWPTRFFQEFIRQAASPHIYMAYVGAGWALARTSLRLSWRLGKTDPLLRWLMFDGLGFHHGYFHPHRAIEQQHRPRELTGYARNVFDQGVGRSIWFSRGADVASVASTIKDFPPERRADLWSGIGLAATYAGAADELNLAQLYGLALGYQKHVSQGATFAAKTRARAGNLNGWTESACLIFCGCRAEWAAGVTDDALARVDLSPNENRYERWRSLIRESFGEQMERCA